MRTHSGSLGSVVDNPLPTTQFDRCPPSEAAAGRIGQIVVLMEDGTMDRLFLVHSHSGRPPAGFDHAAVVLPDGRAVAVTGSHDATVRLGDLQRMTAIQEPLHLVGPAVALAALHLPTGLHLAVVGDGITVVELRHQAL
jgi:hypothetical protein